MFIFLTCIQRSGSKTAVCIKVTPGQSIDTRTPIDYDQLYAQLYAEVRKGCRYWSPVA